MYNKPKIIERITRSGKPVEIIFSDDSFSIGYVEGFISSWTNEGCCISFGGKGNADHDLEEYCLLDDEEIPVRKIIKMPKLIQHHKRKTLYRKLIDEAILEKDLSVNSVYIALEDGVIWIRPKEDIDDTKRYVPQ
jgi:hypothetical protein